MGQSISNGEIKPAAPASLDLESRLKVLILEPRQIFNECLSNYLAQFAGVETISIARAKEWLALSAQHPTPPDMLLLCVPDGERLPTNASDMTSALEGIGSLPIVVMSNERYSGEILEMVKAGVRGFIPTSAPTAVAIQILRLVQAGGTFVPASCLNSVSSQSDRESERGDLFTGRQKQVIEAIRLGKPNKIIAYELNMCESTVKVHVRTIMKKLKAKNRTEVAYLYSSALGSAAEGEHLQLNSVPSSNDDERGFAR